MKGAGFRDLMNRSGRWMLRWRHPFWWLPEVPNAQDESYRRIWSQLRQLDRVTDGRHDTQNFMGRTGDLVIVCARVPANALSPAITKVLETLARYDYVRLIPTSLYEITVQELGYLSTRPNGRDEITQQWLDEYLEQCQISLKDFRPFDVRIGGVNSYPDAAFLDVQDDGWLSRIHDVLVDFVSQPPRTRFPYLPELILAQYTKKARMGRLVHDLTQFRDLEFGGFRVQSIDVLRIPTTEAFAEPTLVQSFPLGRITGFMDRVTSAEARER